MHDFVVVGAGTSGCVVAWRLANLPQRPKVLLIEAGGDNKDVLLRIDGDRWITRMNTAQNYMYTTVPQNGFNNRVVEYDRGRGLGGSSCINFSNYTVGPAGDYDEVSKIVGDDDFAWNNVSEIYRRLETYNLRYERLPECARKYLQPDLKHHGSKGPLHLGFARVWEPEVSDIMDVCTKAGLLLNYDINNGDPIGVGMVPQTAFGGVRSTAADFLAHTPSNLEIVTDTQVLRLVFEGQKCTGVETSRGILNAEKEVILCCGSLDSPGVLMHSGIGPADELKKFGISSRIDLPYVGKRLSDHHHIFIDWERADHTTGRKAYYQSEERQVKARQQWIEDRTGPLSEFGTTLAMAFLKNDAIMNSEEFKALPAERQRHLMQPTVPHLELAFNPATAAYFIDPQTAPALHSAAIFVLNPQSRGTCELQSADPMVPLKFDPKFFSHPYDKRVAIEATRELLRVAEQPDFAKNTIKMWSGPASDSEEDILDFWRKGTVSTWHMSGTVGMGKVGEATTCVDHDFKVVGVEGLRVADMSVVPIMMNCHVQSVAYCMGLLAADKIAKQYGSGNGSL